jgi:tRNA nucleotidyltransferase/poly(A) polymerase
VWRALRPATTTLGSPVAPETGSLMADIVAADELPHLSIERVWVETEKALKEQHPEVFWQVLANCGALPILLPELVISDGIAALTRAAPHTQRADCRWAALLSDLRKRALNLPANGLRRLMPSHCSPRESVPGVRK